MFIIVIICFDRLVNHRWAEISKELGVSPQEVQSAADEISKLDPKPGLQYSAGEGNYIIADLVVEKVDNDYIVFHNDTALPRLRLSRSYREVARDKAKFKGEGTMFFAYEGSETVWEAANKGIACVTVRDILEYGRILHEIRRGE